VKPSMGVTPEEKNLWANLQRIVEKRGRIGKKGDTPPCSRGDTRVKAIKSDSDSDSDEQKRSPVFKGKNRGFRGVTPSVAAPGVTHPSDATVYTELRHSVVRCRSRH